MTDFADPPPETRHHLDELEPELRQRISTLDEPVAHPNWSQVVERARRSPSRYRQVGLLAAGCAAALAVLVLLLTMNSGAHLTSRPKSTYATGVAGITRQEPGTASTRSATLDGRVVLRLSPAGSTNAVYVTVTKGGGVCFEWADANHCKPRLGPLSVLLEKGRLVGDVSPASISWVVIKFTDGTSVQPTISWILAPVQAGFFLYNIPIGKHVEEVTASRTPCTRGQAITYCL